MLDISNSKSHEGQTGVVYFPLAIFNAIVCRKWESAFNPVCISSAHSLAVFYHQTTSSTLKMSTFESYIEFYQRILRNHDKDDSIIINRVEEDILKRGCMSVVYRVSVFGSVLNNDKRKNYQRSMVVKRLPSGEMQGQYQTRIAMDNEKVSYTTIIPALKNHTFGFLPVGSTIFIGADFIILPDLQTEGFFPVGISAGGLTVSQCEVALEGLAKLHAASFVFKNQDQDNFTKISKLTQEIMKKHIGEIEKAFLNNLKEHLEASNHQRGLAALEELSFNLEKRIDHLLKKPDKDLSVICHGDCWAGNMMFSETGEFKFIDLQLMRYNSVAMDLSYLLYVNLDPEEHQGNMQRLLERYLELVKKYTKEKGVNLDDCFTMARLEEEMNTYRVFGVFYGMWTSPVYYTTEKELEESSPLKNYKKLGNFDNAKCAERVTRLLLRYVDAVDAASET